MEERNREETIILRPYSRAWKIERMLYSLGKSNLPFPIAIRTVLYFIFFLFVFQLKIPLIKEIPGTYRTFIIPGVLAFFFSKKTLDGKNPLMWIKSNLIHLLRQVIGANSLNRYKPIKKKYKAVYSTKIAYRTVQYMDED